MFEKIYFTLWIVSIFFSCVSEFFDCDNTFFDTCKCVVGLLFASMFIYWLVKIILLIWGIDLSLFPHCQIVHN